MSEQDTDLNEWLTSAAVALTQAGIEQPRREARFLMRAVLDLPTTALLTRKNLSAHEVDRLDSALARRVAREPMAHITRVAGFWTLDLTVSPDTLIPRADTETLIEALLVQFPDRHKVSAVLDLGTGTGALLLAALSEYPNAYGVGIELNPRAAALARVNAERNRLDHRASFYCGSWADALNGRFDVVLSNPPYIESADIPALMPEVALYEPAAALDGGTDGLDAYRLIIAELPRLLAPSGLAILELGQGQESAVSRVANQYGFRTSSHDDLGGIARALVISQ